MKVLITGSNGMLGKDLCNYLENIGCFVIPTNREIMDITNEDEVKKVILKTHPDLIIHAGAYTNVDKAQEELEKATKINVAGTKNTAKYANEINATMVYISTDYVFDGTKKTPYTPEDKPNPINNYGLTKYQGEKEVQKYCKKYYIARTSWLYGIHGKNFVETMLTLANKDEIKVVNDQIGCPTWTIQLIKGILNILNKPYGIYHICSEGQTSWYEFAKEIFKQENLKVNLKPCTTQEFPRPAKRPKYSVMKCNEMTGDWKEGLREYLKIRKEK